MKLSEPQRKALAEFDTEYWRLSWDIRADTLAALLRRGLLERELMALAPAAGWGASGLYRHYRLSPAGRSLLEEKP